VIQEETRLNKIEDLASYVTGYEDGKEYLKEEILAMEIENEEKKLKLKSLKDELYTLFLQHQEHSPYEFERLDTEV